MWATLDYVESQKTCLSNSRVFLGLQNILSRVSKFPGLSVVVCFVELTCMDFHTQLVPP